ncbi:MAG: alpha-amylase [Balneolaceae bacterium]|nr:alpha-amylase [Balneolaceae bacterium]
MENMKNSIVLILACLLTTACSGEQQTQKRASYDPPKWAEGRIWYQIFPERFRNGDPSNDPDRARARGPEGWEISEWTTDWYARASWEKEATDDFYAIVRERRYGGDLQGVIDKLDYLKELGIGGIYFNPIFDAQSMHKYDGSYYHHIDRNFGPNPEADTALFNREDPGDPASWEFSSADSLFLELLEEAHKRDIKIVIDGVWNHTGTEFWAFQDLVKNQQNSPYKEWYIVNSFDNPATTDISEFDYEGWWGFKGLPVFREEQENLVRPIREHIFAVTRRWMDPNGDGDPSDGVDGWRLDVASEVGKEFWKDWHELVYQLNPKAITFAEIWTDEAKEFISADLFTSVMNYRFAYAAKDFLIDDRIDTQKFIRRLNALEDEYPEGSVYVLQNLLDSHDTARLASMIVNPGLEYDRDGHPRDGFKVRKPNTKERKVQRLVALFQFSWRGAPMIYYGTEAGMWGADDPDDRKPMVWNDLSYEPESVHPLGKERPQDDNNFDEELFKYYQQLAELRTQSQVLQRGSAEFIYQDAAAKVVAFQRELEGQNPIYVFLNRSADSQFVTIELPVAKDELTNLISGERVQLKEGTLAFEIPSVSGVVLQ